MTNPVNPLKQYNSLQTSLKIAEGNPASITTRGIASQKDLFIDRDATGAKKGIKQIFSDLLAWILSLPSKVASFFKKSPSENEEVDGTEGEEEVHENELNENEVDGTEGEEKIHENELNKNEVDGTEGEEEVVHEENIDETKGEEEVVHEENIDETKGEEEVVREENIDETKGEEEVVREEKIDETKGKEEVHEENIDETKGEEEVVREEKIDETKGKEEVRNADADADAAIERQEQILEARKKKFHQIPDLLMGSILQKVKERNDKAGGNSTTQQLHQGIMDYHYPVENRHPNDPAHAWINLANPDSVINQEIQAFFESTQNGIRVLEQIIRVNNLEDLRIHFDTLDPAIKGKIYELMTLHYAKFFEKVDEEKINEVETRICRVEHLGMIFLVFPTEPFPRNCQLLDMMTPAVRRTLSRVENGSATHNQLSAFYRTLQESNASSNLQSSIINDGFLNLSPNIRREIAKAVHKETLLSYAKKLMSGEEQDTWAYQVIHEESDIVKGNISLHYREHLLEEDSLFRKSLNLVKGWIDRNKASFENPIEI